MKTKHKPFLLLQVLLVVWKSEGITSRISRVKNYLRSQRTLWRVHRPKADLSGLQPPAASGDEWFSRYHFIAHNGGIIQGRLSSDSREAWELSYSRGVRIIDADLSFTSDNHLVLRHDWKDDLEQDYFPNQPVLETFRAGKIFMKYSPMTAEDVITFMLAHPDLYVAGDSKYDPVLIFSALAETARNMHAEEVLSRVIVSLYRTEDILRVRAACPFRHYVLRQYGWRHNWYELADFCLKNNVPAVNVWHTVIDADPEGVKILTSKGIHVFAAVVNSLKQMQAYKDLGITGAVSDYLNESDWRLLQ